jgi:hypothetical protein
MLWVTSPFPEIIRIEINDRVKEIEYELEVHRDRSGIRTAILAFYG